MMMLFYFLWTNSQTVVDSFAILSLLVTQSREGEGRVGDAKAPPKNNMRNLSHCDSVDKTKR